MSFRERLWDLLDVADTENIQLLENAYPRDVSEWRRNKGLEVTVITADGTGQGRLMADDSIEFDQQRCGCPVEYHLADCPIRVPAFSEDEHLEAEYEDRHPDDPSLEDTTPEELLRLDAEAYGPEL